MADTEKVLIAVDDSPQAEKALEYAFDKHSDAHLTALTVIDPAEAGYEAGSAFPSFSEEWYESAKERAQANLDEAKGQAESAGIDMETDTEVGPPANTIVDYADDNDFDHIIVGSHGRSGISRVLLGSVAETIVRRSPVPVTVVR